MQQVAPTGDDAARHEVALVYHPGQCPGWKVADDPMQPEAAAAAVPTGMAYASFASLLHATSLDTLNEVRRRVARLDRAELIQRYRTAHAVGKRLTAHVMAAELIERGIPPCFWHEVLALDDTTVAHRADLLLADLAWLRRWHPDHAGAVRYQRGKALLTGSLAVFHREAEFAFYQGRRPAWRIVGSMSMTERQQWEAAYLRSTPIKKEAEATAILSQRVRKALHDDLRTTRRTATFGDGDAQASLARRHALWYCSRMVKDGSPTEIAARYQQMTGRPITRQTAAKQLAKVRAVLRDKGDDYMD